MMVGFPLSARRRNFLNPYNWMSFPNLVSSGPVLTNCSKGASKPIASCIGSTKTPISSVSLSGVSNPRHLEPTMA